MNRITQLVRPGGQRPGDALREEVEREEFARVRTWLNIHTRHLDDGVGLVIERARLDDGEVRDLLALTARVSSGQKVSKSEGHRWERLVEVAAGREPGSVFAPAREANAAAVGFARLATLAAKKRRPRWEEEDAVVIPAAVTRAVRDGELDGVDLLILYRLLAAHAGVLGPGDTVDDGRVIDEMGCFLGGLDPDSVISGTPFSLNERLAPEHWITVERIGGGKIAVAPGPRLLAAMEERDKT